MIRILFAASMVGALIITLGVLTVLAALALLASTTADVLRKITKGTYEY